MCILPAYRLLSMVEFAGLVQALPKRAPQPCRCQFYANPFLATILGPFWTALEHAGKH